MSRLTVYEDNDPETPVLRIEDSTAIADALRLIGVRFERWDSPVVLTEDTPPDAIVEAYTPTSTA